MRAPDSRSGQRRRVLALAVLLALLVTLLSGCLRVRASITVSPDDLVSGQIVAAAVPRDDDDKGPQLVNNLPFGHKVSVTKYETDEYVGSQAVFSNLTFAELPQLAGLNDDAAGVDLQLRRAGSLVILEGRVDLTTLVDQEADVALTVSFPGEVTSTNGERIDSKVVQWQLQPGVVNAMSAQARYTDPATRSFTGGALVLGIAAVLVAGATGLLAWAARDRSAKPGAAAEVG